MSAFVYTKMYAVQFSSIFGGRALSGAGFLVNLLKRWNHFHIGHSKPHLLEVFDNVVGASDAWEVFNTRLLAPLWRDVAEPHDCGISVDIFGEVLRNHPVLCT